MAQTITVTSLQSLYTALAHAKGGETIALAAGNYGDMCLSAKSGFNLTFPSNVTITSADPLHPAVFSGLDLRNVSNLSFDSVVFDYKFAAGDNIYDRPFSISGGANVTVKNSTFDGDVAKGVSAIDDGYGYAIGLSLRGVKNAHIDGNEFYNFHRGMSISDSKNVTVSHNDLHSMRMDGMDFSQVQGVVIEGNQIHDFRGSPKSADHCDMIQFWTNGTTAPSTDIVIRNNTLDVGQGSATQSIFMRNDQVDRGLAGTEMFYKNVTIENNVITNAHLHGITVGETNGLIVRQNSVLHTDGGKVDGADAAVEIPQINIAAHSTGVVVTGNATAGINGWTGQAGWSVAKNAFVQDQQPGAPGYYGDVFVSSTLQNDRGLHHFTAIPGGMIDRLGAGADNTRGGFGEVGALQAAFQVAEDKGGAIQTRIFDAALSHSDFGTMPAGTVYEWNFGDGVKARGQFVVHDFAHPGKYNVSLTVLLPGGQSNTVQTSVGVQDGHLLGLGANGIFQATEYATHITLAPGASISADGIQLNSTGVAASVARAHVAELLTAQDFDVSLRLDADVKGTTGEVFRLHGSMIGAVNASGEFTLRASPTIGTEIKLTSTGIKVNDLRAHDIDIRLDDGKLQLWVDGKMSSEAAFAGTLKSDSKLDMTFGNQWGQKNFVGDISAFDVTVGDHTSTPIDTLLHGHQMQVWNIV